MTDQNAPRIIPWLLIFLYFSFLYTFGAKLSTLLYTDFPSFYYGARLSFVEKHSPYDEQALTAIADRERILKPGEPRPRIYPYLYPPPSLLMFYPLAKLHVGAAKAALLATNHLCLLAIIGMVLIPIAGFAPREVFTLILPASLAIYLFFSHGIDSTIELGQVNLIILALLCIAWWALQKDGPAWLIALPLGLACVFKIYPVMFLALLLVRRKYWAAGLTVAVLLAVCGLSWLVLPHSLWHQWQHDVLPTGGYLSNPLGVFPPTLAGNIGLAGFMARIFLPPKLFMEVAAAAPGPAMYANAHLGKMLTYLCVALFAAITTAVCFFSARKQTALPTDRERQINFEFSSFLILTFLVAPLAWGHHLAYVAPAVVIALLAVTRDRPTIGRGFTPMVIALIACLLGWPMTIGKLPLPRVAQILAVSLKFYAVVILWLFLLHEMLRQRALIPEETVLSPVKK